MKKFLYIVLPILIVFILVFTRLYNIKNGLFFYNDLGRDADVLYTWIKTGKPPLLGPQTSALPINQSPVYFYWLMIFYFLLNTNPIYSVVGCLFFYILVFIFGLYFFRKEKFLIKLWLGGFFLITIHPQNIIQSRYVWNPSFVSPLILLSTLSFYQAIKNDKNFFLSSFSLALAISFSYSVVPLFFVFILYLVFYQKDKILKFFLYFILSLGLFYLPILVFEVRHHFLLTYSLLTKKGPQQQFIDFFSKFNSISNFVVGFNYQIYERVVFVFIFLYSIIKFLYWHKKNKNKGFFYFNFFVLILLTFLIPITIQAHYIFAITVSFFIVILLDQKAIEILILMLCLFFYFMPIFKNKYFQKAPRTYEEINQCFLSFCQNFKKPIYVSVVSSLHPYHYGPEHRYLLKKNGCLVYNIEENQNQSDLMMVILDFSDFNKEFKYYELDLFGPYKIIKKHYCQNNFGYVLIRKLTKVK